MAPGGRPRMPGAGEIHASNFYVYGIVVYLYFVDNKRHKRPHIHVKYQKDEAVVSIPDGDILQGKLPRAKMRLVLAWVEIHREELVADWQLAASGQQPFKITPLR